MADKPKTYAQQVQELKDQLQQRDEQLNEALQKTSFIEEMQGEIAHLREQLAQYQSSAQQSGVSTKAQLTDAIQRAESAEQGVRNAQARIKELEDLKAQLESQVNVFAMEADKTVGKDKKVTHLEETIKNLNFQILQLTTRNRDLQQENTRIEAEMVKQVSYWRGLYTTANTHLENLKSRIKGSVDPFADLR